jgi:hypothetical protein
MTWTGEAEGCGSAHDGLNPEAQKLIMISCNGCLMKECARMTGTKVGTLRSPIPTCVRRGCAEERLQAADFAGCSGVGSAMGCCATVSCSAMIRVTSSGTMTAATGRAK